MQKLPRSALSPEQQDAITRLYEHDQTLLIAGLGFGKSVVGLTALSELLAAGVIKRALVIAPLRVIHNAWVRECHQWEHLSPDLFASAAGGPGHRAAGMSKGAPIVGINFESAAVFIKEYGDQFDALLIDELSMLKSSGGELFKTMRPWVKRLVWRAGVTATPVAEHGMDLYGQALLLDDGKALGTRQEAFQNKYFVPLDYNGYSWGLRQGAAEQIASALKGLVYRASDSAYLSGLPELRDELVEVPMSDMQQALYAEMRKEGVVAKLDVVAANAAVQAGKLAQIASGGLYRGDDRELVWHDKKNTRAQMISEYVAQFYPDISVVITYNYAFQLEALKLEFPKAPVLGSGGICSPADLEAFNQGRIPVLLGHPRSMSHGLNLQGVCRTLIHYAPLYSADRYRQSIGRIHRRGQKASFVRRVSFFTPGTVEENTVRALARKAEDEKSLMLHLG